VRDGNAVDADGAPLTRAPEADGKDVWFRHPKGWCQVRAEKRGRRWQKRRAHRGEHVI